MNRAEIKLKISPHFQPLPYICAVLPGRVESPHPTLPVEVVVEILSLSNELPAVLDKCRFYHDLKIPKLYVVDPEVREITRWHQNSLQPVSSLLTIHASEIWDELDRRLKNVSR